MNETILLTPMLVGILFAKSGGKGSKGGKGPKGSGKGKPFGKRTSSFIHSFIEVFALTMGYNNTLIFLFTFCSPF
jgi:hypothetical protein